MSGQEQVACLTEVIPAVATNFCTSRLGQMDSCFAGMTRGEDEVPAWIVQ
jgi:hypothetical protein